MQIQPVNNLLLIKKHKNTALKADIAVSDDDADKRLITGEVISGEGYEKGTTVVFGKYAVLKLTMKGEDFFFLDKDDIIATSTYKE